MLQERVVRGLLSGSGGTFVWPLRHLRIFVHLKNNLVFGLNPTSTVRYNTFMLHLILIPEMCKDPTVNQGLDI